MIKPIQTFYDGHWFRSRAEAKWAVFFNEVGCPYQYEPEGYEMDGGVRYLPDFRLPIDFWGRDCYLGADYPQELYVEVKGRGILSDEEIHKILTFSEYYPTLVVGDVPLYITKLDGIRERTWFPMFWNGWTMYRTDYSMFFTMKDGRLYVGEYMNQGHLLNEALDEGGTIQKALTAARYKRFEYEDRERPGQWQSATPRRDPHTESAQAAVDARAKTRDMGYNDDLKSLFEYMTKRANGEI